MAPTTDGNTPQLILDAPVVPLRVRHYCDFMEVTLKKGLRNEHCRLLNDLVKPHAGRPDKDRLWIRPTWKNVVRVRQPTVDELLILDRLIPSDETSPVTLAEFAYDFFPNDGELEALTQFMANSVVFPQGVGGGSNPRPYRTVVYFAPNDAPVRPKFYADLPSKLVPNGRRVPHLCYCVDGRTLDDWGVRRPTDYSHNFDSRGFLSTHLRLVNGNLDRLLARAAPVLTFRRPCLDITRMLRRHLSLVTWSLDGCAPGQGVYDYLRDFPALPPEFYELGPFLPEATPVIPNEIPCQPFSSCPPVTGPKPPDRQGRRRCRRGPRPTHSVCPSFTSQRHS